MIDKPIYKPKGRAGEYGDYAINIYTGCNHGCTYCFARKMKERYTPKDCICTFDDPKPRRDIVESVRRQLDQGKIKDKLIHLCFTCDPYPADIDTTPTREIIKAIKDSGNHVQILTKGGGRSLRDFDLLDGEDYYGITITGATSTTGEEPYAATPADRIFHLRKAHDLGIKTWVSFEPVIKPGVVYWLITHDSACMDLIKIGKLNYFPSNIDWAEFGREAERLCQENALNYYIKDDLRKLMG